MRRWIPQVAGDVPDRFTPPRWRTPRAGQPRLFGVTQVIFAGLHHPKSGTIRRILTRSALHSQAPVLNLSMFTASQKPTSGARDPVMAERRIVRC